MKDYQIINIEFKGNVLLLIGGKNSEQWGDDWGDVPFEHNAGDVYSKYIQFKTEVALPFDAEIELPEHEYCNSPYAMEDFINRKLARCTIRFRDQALPLFFGDEIQEVIQSIENLINP